jgi:hypothetical protein
MDLRVGIPAQHTERKDESSGEELNNAQLMAIHEYGAPEHHIPERSIFRYTFAKEKAFHDDARKLAKKVGEEAITPTMAVNLLGAKARDELRQSFTDGHLTPNAPSTIRQKKSSRPLIDTGQLRQSITWVVNGKVKGQ